MLTEFLKIQIQNTKPYDFGDEMANDWLRNEVERGERQPASVVLLFRGSNASDAEVLLTKRTAHLSTHAGQVAFPGGGLKVIDEQRTDKAALRELQEEVGISVASIALIGELPKFPTVTGNFLVSPWVGYLSRPTEIQIDPNEVEHCDWVKVSDVIENLQWEERHSRGVLFRHPVFYWKSEKVWGVTAWILYNLIKDWGRI